MANDHVKMFTEEYTPIAQQVSKQIGVSPSILLAQWGMETDYGRKVPGHFNFGNIKDMSGAGTSAVDNKSKTKDNYVNFESPEAFGDYYAHMMRRLYPKALNAGDDISKYAQGLRTGVKGSYAEDENYEQAIRGAHKLTSGFFADTGSEEKKSESPFANYESESSKFKREQEEAKRNEPPKPNPEDEQGGIGAPEAGAVAGSIANVLFPPMTSPERAVKMDTGKAEEANLLAQDKLELARRNLQDVAPQGTTDLEESFRQSQGELERLKNEQRLAQERLKGLPKSAPPMEAPTAPAPVDDPSRTKAGASGAVNYVRAMSDDVPDVLAEQALNMRKDNPRGGQAIIDANALAIQKQADLGLGDYGLTRTEGGVQLALPPTTVAERQADIDRQNKESQAELAQKTEQARLQQEAQAQKLEQQRLAYEADLERLRQERAQAGQQLNEVTGQKRTVAPLQRSLTKAENDAEIAKRKLQRAQQQPNATGRTLQNVGTGSAKIGALPRAGVGAGAGYLGVMSYQEALERYKAGDTSEAVIKALEAGAATAAVIPPAGKKLTKVRGAGVLGGLGLGTYELGKRLLKDAPPEE
jgi:TolA-binding protein